MRRPLYAEHGPQLILLCGFLEKWNKTKSHHDPHHSHFVFKTSFTQGLTLLLQDHPDHHCWDAGRQQPVFSSSWHQRETQLKKWNLYAYIYMFICLFMFCVCIYTSVNIYIYICVCVRVYVWLLFIALHTYVYNSWSLALDLQTIQLVCWLIPGPLSQQLVGVFRPWQTSWQCTSNRGACWVALVCGEMLETGSMAQTVDRFGNLQSWEIDFLISPKIPRVTFPNQLN